jgi:hypothetical protein
MARTMTFRFELRRLFILGALLGSVVFPGLRPQALAAGKLEVSPTDDPEAVFSAIAEAWAIGDEEALADLVHRDGLLVTSGDYTRPVHYSPSQAFYYFKNQFRQHPTTAFEFKRLQNSRARLDREEFPDRLHGMVIWEYRRTGRKSAEELKLVLVLSRENGAWRLSEINTITSR